MPVLLIHLKILKTSLIQRTFLSFEWIIATSCGIKFRVWKRFQFTPPSEGRSGTIITCKDKDGLTIRLFLCCLINLFDANVHCTNHRFIQGSLNQSRSILWRNIKGLTCSWIPGLINYKCLCYTMRLVSFYGE